MPTPQEPTPFSDLETELKSASDAIDSVINQINQNESSGKPLDVKAARSQLASAKSNISGIVAQLPQYKSPPTYKPTPK